MLPRPHTATGPITNDEVDGLNLNAPWSMSPATRSNPDGLPGASSPRSGSMKFGIGRGENEGPSAASSHSIYLERAERSSSKDEDAASFVDGIYEALGITIEW